MHLFSRLRLFRLIAVVVIGVMALPSFGKDKSPNELQIEGRWYPGALLKGKVAPGSVIEVLGRKVRQTNKGYFVFGLGRDEKGPVEIKISNLDGTNSTYSYQVEPRDYKIQKIEGIEKKYVSPPKEVLDRIRKDSAMVRAARKADDDRTDFLKQFVWPIQGRITGVYGSQRYYNGVPKRPHYGIDIAAPQGAIVKAPTSGKVTLVHDDMYYSGGTLIVDHGHGVSSTFIHLSDILVQKGQIVDQGQAIAKVGSTGRSTGPHLDWRMNWFEQRIDPSLLVPELAIE